MRPKGAHGTVGFAQRDRRDVDRGHARCLVSVYLRAHGGRDVAAAIGYGLVLYVAMFLIVLSLGVRWHSFHARGVAEMLFSHIVVVSPPIAWFARK